MYDVLYLDRRGGPKPLATGLTAEAAAEIARSEARRRGVGRMFLAGSESLVCGSQVLIVEHPGGIARAA